MWSKSKPKPTTAEKRHIERLASQPCVICGASPPSEVHEQRQGDWWTAIPCCAACHRGSAGWHGDKSMWRVRKLDELGALNLALERLLA